MIVENKKVGLRDQESFYLSIVGYLRFKIKKIFDYDIHFNDEGSSYELLIYSSEPNFRKEVRKILTDLRDMETPMYLSSNMFTIKIEINHGKYILNKQIAEQP